MQRIAIFASGTGTNAEHLTKYFAHHKAAKVCLLVYNKQDADVARKLNGLDIPTNYVSSSDIRIGTSVLLLLQQYKIDLIVLAGFLQLVPKVLIDNFTQRIINIHPALLPHYGGKGMYGIHVHKAVIKAKEPLSGITIHLVEEDYDKGEILFQTTCNISLVETPESLADKIHSLEYLYYPKVIEAYCTKLNNHTSLQHEAKR